MHKTYPCVHKRAVRIPIDGFLTQQPSPRICYLQTHTVCSGPKVAYSESTDPKIYQEFYS